MEASYLSARERSYRFEKGENYKQFFSVGLELEVYV